MDDTGRCVWQFPVTGNQNVGDYSFNPNIRVCQNCRTTRRRAYPSVARGGLDDGLIPERDRVRLRSGAAATLQPTGAAPILAVLKPPSHSGLLDAAEPATLSRGSRVHAHGSLAHLLPAEGFSARSRARENASRLVVASAQWSGGAENRGSRRQERPMKNQIQRTIKRSTPAPPLGP